MHINNGNRSSVAILYGRAGDLPDTLDVQSVSLLSSDGRFSLFSDVTGDNVPELLVGSGRRDFVKVYVGLKGQRLLEQYGSGNDSAQAGADRWWGKPWATLWLPRKVNPNWFGDNDRLFDLGDANMDGVGDIYAFSWPYLLEYNGGSRMDSLADALHNITPAQSLKTAVLLGDIDGSGRQTIAAAGSGIAFLQGSRSIPWSGVLRRLPQGTGKAGVEEREGESVSSFTVNAIPNPASGDVNLVWNKDICRDKVAIRVYDERGLEIARYEAEPLSGSFYLSGQSFTAGYYLITLSCSGGAATTSIVVR